MDVAELRVIVGANMEDFDRELKALDSKLDRTAGNAVKAGDKMTAGLTAPVKALGAAAGSLKPLETGLNSIAAAADRAQGELRELSGVSVNPGVNASGVAGLQAISGAADKLQTELKELAGAGVNIPVNASTAAGLQAIAAQIDGVEQDVKSLSGAGVDIPVDRSAVTDLGAISQGTDRLQADLRQLSGTAVNIPVNTSATSALQAVGKEADKLQSELQELGRIGIQVPSGVTVSPELQKLLDTLNRTEAEVRALDGTKLGIAVDRSAVTDIGAIAQAADKAQAELKELSGAGTLVSVGVNVSVDRGALAGINEIARAADAAEEELKELSKTPVTVSVSAAAGLQEIGRVADQVEGELRDLSRQGVNIPVSPATAAGLSTIAGQVSAVEGELKDLSRQGVNIPVSPATAAGLAGIAGQVSKVEGELKGLARQGVSIPVDTTASGKLAAISDALDKTEAKLKAIDRKGVNVIVDGRAVQALEGIRALADRAGVELKELSRQGVSIPVSTQTTTGLEAITGAVERTSQELRELASQGVSVPVAASAVAGLEGISRAADAATEDLKELGAQGVDVGPVNNAPIAEQIGLLKQLQNRLGELKKLQESAFDEKAVIEYNTEIKSVQNEINRLTGKPFTDLKKEAEEAAAATAKLAKSAETTAERMVRLGTSAQGIGSGLSKYVTAPIVAAGVASFGAYAKIDSLKRGLDSLNNSAEKTEKELAALTQIAKLPGLGLPEVVKAEVNLRTIGFTADKAQKSITEFGNAVALVGKGREEFEGAIYGLQQLANTEFPLGEDLNIIKERIPQVTPLLKEAFGTARSEDLQKLGITSERVVNTIIDGLGKLPRATAGPGVAIENLSDTFTVAGATIGKSLDQSFGITDKINAFADGLTGAADAFSKLSPEAQATTASIVGLAAATGPVLFGIGGVIKLLPTMVAGFNAVRASVLSLNGALAAGVIGLAALAAYQGLELLNAPTDADRNIAEQERYTAEYKALSKERQEAAEAELRAAAQNEARQIAQSQRVIEAIKGANEEIRKRNGIDTEGGFSFRTQSTNPADLKALKENEQKLKDYEAKLGTATERLSVFRARLKGVDEAAKGMGATLDEVKPKVATIADTKIADAIAEIENKLKTADKSFAVFGDAFDVVGEKTSILESGIKNLLELGLKPADKAIQDFFARAGKINLDAFKNLSLDIQPLEPKDLIESSYRVEIDIFGNLRKVDAKSYELINIKEISANDLGFGALLDMSAGLKTAALSGMAFGDSLGANREKAQILEGTIRSLIENGFAPQSETIQLLKKDFDEVNAKIGSTIETGPLLAEAVQGATNAFIDFGIGLATGSASAEQLAGGLLTNIGDMLIGLGKSALMAGLGVEAIKAALGSLQGVGAIAAGAALIALGAVVKSGVKGLVSGGGGAVSRPSISGGGASAPVLSTTSNRPQASPTSNVSNNVRANQGNGGGPQRIEIFGETVIRGADLLALFKNAEDAGRRVGTNG